MADPSDRRPTNRQLERMYITERMSYAQIAQQLGVGPTSVQRWISAAGIQPRPTGDHVVHRDFLPWPLTTADSQDDIARALRALAKQRNGLNLAHQQEQILRNLTRHLAMFNRVLCYSRELALDPKSGGTGWHTIDREDFDDPAMIIRPVCKNEWTN